MEAYSASKEIILIVDDIPNNIVALTSLLENNNRQFLNASNGRDALMIAMNKAVDLIMLDVQMAEMDGFEVARILKSNNKTKDIPIIFVSAINREHTSIMKGLEGGAVDYLSKPLDPEITKAKVSIFLKLQQQKKELIEKNISLEKSALLINNSADILGVLDKNSLVFEEVNNAFKTILDYTPEEIIGTSLYMLTDSESRHKIDNLSREFKDRIFFEIPVASKSGEIKWLQWHVAINEGKWFINARDISQQKIADDKIKKLNVDLQESLSRMQEMNSELDAFSYSISHDLRAPLRSINGYSKILEEDYISQLDEKAKELLGIIQNNAIKMGSLIDDLLEFSRLGRKEINKRPIEVNKLVAEVLAEIKHHTINNSDIQVKDLLPVNADQALLTQVMINLISNAVKYSGKNISSKIEIGSYKEAKEIVYYVKDNGVGFNMEYVNKLFNVFQRLHSAKEFNGTGVGLAIVSRIINKHGGKVWAEGKVNEGATFYFSLPD